MIANSILSVAIPDLTTSYDPLRLPSHVHVHVQLCIVIILHAGPTMLLVLVPLGVTRRMQVFILESFHAGYEIRIPGFVQPTK